MVEKRWLLRLVPPAAGALAVGLITATSIGAADAAWEPPDCPGGAERLVAATRGAGPAGPPDLADEAWFTLDGRLDASGALAGQRLRIGTGGDRARFVELPAESSAAGPFGRIILVVADDGRHSRVRAIDRRAGCGWTIGTSADVVRRATLDPSGASVYEYRVDRRSRADLGVWQRPVDGSAPRRVLAPLPADRAVGITFSTTLAWSAEADRLVVQQCGSLRCRTRLFDPSAGQAVIQAAADQGELLGVAEGQIVTYAACPGLPCPVVATHLASGRRTVVAEAVALARLVATPGGARIAAETGIEGGSIAVIRLDGTLDTTVELPDPELRLMPAPDRAMAGTRTPPGWLVVAPDGRSPDAAVLTRLADGATVDVGEVAQ